MRCFYHGNNFQRKLRSLIWFQVHICQVHIDCHPSWPAPPDHRLQGTGFISPLPPSCSSRAKKQQRLQFPSQQRCRKSKKNNKKSVQQSSTLCNFSAKWILFNLSAWDGPGPLDNVDGWCFNAAECYFYWTGKTINSYFIGNDCAPCIKLAAAARCPWIIASRSRCYFAETNSSDKICTRLIVYSCFMARCNLNTFMISLKAHQRQRSLPSEETLYSYIWIHILRQIHH